eukprot:1820131-Amphidinium_carterae.1
MAHIAGHSSLFACKIPRFAALNQAIGLLGAVPQIYRMCPKKEWPTIKDRKDPRISKNIDGKNTLRIYVARDTPGSQRATESCFPILSVSTLTSLPRVCGGEPWRSWVFAILVKELVEDWVDAFSEREDQPRKIPRGRSLWKARPYVPMDEPDGALWQIVGGHPLQLWLVTCYTVAYTVQQFHSDWESGSVRVDSLQFLLAVDSLLMALVQRRCRQGWSVGARRREHIFASNSGQAQHRLHCEAVGVAGREVASEL